MPDRHPRVTAPKLLSHRHLVALVSQQGFDRFEGLRDDFGEPHRLASQVDATLGDARDVEQVVHEPREVRHLPANDADGSLRAHVRWQRSRQHFARVPDRRERIAQLVRQHCEKFIFLAIGHFELRDRLPMETVAFENRADASEQLAPGERLDEIVVGACVQALDARLFAGSRGQQDHRYAAQFRARSQCP